MARRPQPAPISLKKPRRKKKVVVVAAVEPFNKDAPEHKEQSRIVTKIVKDRALEARVSLLEGAEIVTPIVKVEIAARPRIERVKIKYDAFGMPEEMIPVYGE